MRLALVALLLAAVALGTAWVAQRQQRDALAELRAGQAALERRVAELAEAQQAARAARERPRVEAPARRGAGGPGAAPRAGRPPTAAPPPGPRAARAPEPRAPVALDDALARFETRFGRGRIDALEQLAEPAARGDTRALDAIVHALADDDPRVREEALRIVESLGHPALLPEIARLLDDPSPEVREQLADTLEEMPMDEAGPLLRRLLDDPEPDVAAEAIQSIGTRAWQPGRRDLERMLDDPNLDLVAEAAAALRQLGDDEAADAAVARVAAGLRGSDPQQRREALLRVRLVGGPEARRFYEQAIDDPEPDIRDVARRELQALR